MTDWIQWVQPKWAKVLDHNRGELERAIEVSPHTKWLGRLWFDPDQKKLIGQKEKGAEELVKRLKERSTWPLIEVWEGVNEPGPHPTNDLMRFQVRLTELLHAEGKKVAIGGWSVGTPDIPDWDSTWFYEPFRTADFISIHEYCAPRMDSEFRIHSGNPDIQPEVGGYYTLRHKKWYDKLPMECRKPILVTECGIDSGGTGWDAGAQGGWKSFTNIDDYLLQMEWYRTYCHPRVEAIFPFCFGARDKTWESFDLFNPEEARRVFGEYIIGLTAEQPPTEEWIDLRGLLPVHPTLRYKTRSRSDIDTLVIHHTATAPTIDPYAIANWHVWGVTDTKKEWPGISYHWVIDMTGKTYQVNDEETISYHCGKHNGHTVGVALIGNFMEAPPTEAQLVACKRLTTKLGLKVAPHKQLVDTLCPGDTWDSWKGRLTEVVVDWQARALNAESKLLAIKEIIA